MGRTREDWFRSCYWGRFQSRSRSIFQQHFGSLQHLQQLQRRLCESAVLFWTSSCQPAPFVSLTFLFLRRSFFSKVGDTYSRPIWDEIYLKNATERLGQYVQGLNLTNELVYGMQSLCAYETVSLGYSDFCGLFTKAEWEGFEYDLDLQCEFAYRDSTPVSCGFVS